MEVRPHLSTSSSFELSMNINQLEHSLLAMIFEYLPLSDLMRMGDVCEEWKTPQRYARNCRKSVFIIGPNASYTMMYLHAFYNIKMDQHNCFMVNWSEILSTDFCKNLSQNFPNIEKLGFSLEIDEDIDDFFLSQLLGPQVSFPKMVSFQLIISQKLSIKTRFYYKHDFMSRLQNQFLCWNNILNDINFSSFAKQLKHLTLYNTNTVRDFQHITLNITENFSNLISLEELNFGLQCRNMSDIFKEFVHMKNLNKFILLDYIHRPHNRDSFQQLSLIETNLPHRTTNLCLTYSHHEVLPNLLCLDIITARCAALIDVHLCWTNIPLPVLFNKLSPLVHLRHLRLSGITSNHFQIDYENEIIAPLPSLQSLHLNCEQLFDYSLLKNLVEKYIPNLHVIQFDILNCFYFLDDFLFPEEDLFVDDSMKRLIVMSPQNRIKTEKEHQESRSRSSTRDFSFKKTPIVTLDNVDIESAQMGFLEQLFPLLNSVDELKHLRFECPADNFTFYNINQTIPIEGNRLISSLQTLELDCSATGQLPSDNFVFTSNNWPNLRLLKLRGVHGTINGLCKFPSDEHKFLMTLVKHFKQLQKVLLIKDCRIQPTFDDLSDNIFQSNTYFSMQYLFHKPDKSTFPQLLLTVGQQTVF
ncbi:hypothetical protein BLOT_006020 [Blomia tropicalis]|nr:hypothetical protein BLOT_006020 [Blomia tropicalis]